MRGSTQGAASDQGCSDGSRRVLVIDLRSRECWASVVEVDGGSAFLRSAVSGGLPGGRNFREAVAERLFDLLSARDPQYADRLAEEGDLPAVAEAILSRTTVQPHGLRCPDR